jgi:uncharacterized damage-inducible protein DinB
MDIRELLIKQTTEAFHGEMSLMEALADLTQEEASWRMNDTTWTIEEIVYHVASCKIEYCKQGFGRWDTSYPKPIGEINAMLTLLGRAQEHLVQCLSSCSLEDLERPINVRHHGQSAAHFFWIMIMHDINHASQIDMVRRAFGTRTDFYQI